MVVVGGAVEGEPPLVLADLHGLRLADDAVTAEVERAPRPSSTRSPRRASSCRRTRCRNRRRSRWPRRPRAAPSAASACPSVPMRRSGRRSRRMRDADGLHRRTLVPEPRRERLAGGIGEVLDVGADGSAQPAGVDVAVEPVEVEHERLPSPGGGRPRARGRRRAWPGRRSPQLRALAGGHDVAGQHPVPRNREAPWCSPPDRSSRSPGRWRSPFCSWQCSSY